jgi:hypothetical protein
MKEKDFEFPKERLCSPGINFRDYKVSPPKVKIREISPGLYEVSASPTGRDGNLILTRKNIENLITQLESFLQDSETEEAQQDYSEVRW